MNAFNIVGDIRCHLQFFSQITDVIIYSFTRICITFLIPYNLHNHFISEHTTWIKNKQSQNIKFFCCQFNLFSIYFNRSVFKAKM